MSRYTGPVAADADVLIALLDPAHIHHERVRDSLERIETGTYDGRPVVAFLHPLTAAEVLYGYPEPERVGLLDDLLDGSAGFVIPDDLPARQEALLLARYRIHEVKTPDACVLALARLRNVPVMTMDKRLVAGARRVGGLGIWQPFPG